MKDHYEQYGGLEVRQAPPVSTPVAVKLKRKKLTSENFIIKTGKSKNHYFSIFKNDFTNIDTLMQSLDQLNINCSETDRELIQFNYYVRIRYFLSDYEASLYNYKTFFNFFRDFCSKANISALTSRRPADGLTFADWRNVKRHLLPFKAFNKSLIEKVSAQKYYSSADNSSRTIPNVS